MGSAFSKKKTKRREPSEVDKAVLSLKTQRRKLGEYQRQVQNKVVNAHQQAQACIRQKNKAKAVFNLKQKKIFEIRLGEIEQYLINVEETLCNIDTAKQNNKVFEALKSGNAALKTIQAKVSISALQDLVADTEAAKEHEETVNSILANENVDMADLENELSMLEDEIITEETVEQLPKVPKEPLPEIKSEKVEQASAPEAKAQHAGQEQPMLAS
eukprot:CAMPEP_0197476498 /NCGR_PEP_ID=MMETSP1309-20131121/7755_1 /TAXON_ID=464262 /ORGANISM="Genus nov. species nov., Strain RCC998" /LENGTH=214 /DNA_ID=CAMNT_0043016759 /DNA_START=274 /DNA_END=921 /DNA_ORIENTATION=+